MQAKLASVASNVLGVSGRAMLDALVAGNDDPAALAELAPCCTPPVDTSPRLSKQSLMPRGRRRTRLTARPSMPTLTRHSPSAL